MRHVLIDPVCDMFVEPEGAITQEYQGQIYYFCEPVCRDTFNDEPKRWARPGSEENGLIEAMAAPAVG
jgi:YHS domain-containing protein